MKTDRQWRAIIDSIDAGYDRRELLIAVLESDLKTLHRALSIAANAANSLGAKTHESIYVSQAVLELSKND